MVTTKTDIRVESLGQANLVDMGGQFGIAGHAAKLSLQTPQPTPESLAFVDITDEVVSFVRQTGIIFGVALLYSKHTTCTVVINERETLLMKDVALFLERLAPRNGYYHHNQFDIRTENMNPDEFPNGHAHCLAWLLGPSQWVPVLGGDLTLGTWQRLFMVELDAARPRELVVMAIGAAGSRG